MFAPTNAAFEKVPAATLQSLTKDPTGALANVLKYHVVAGTLTPANLAGTHMTLEGQNITVTGSGESFTVNGTAQVVCGNVKTANATVYVIDGVLVPRRSSPRTLDGSQDGRFRVSSPVGRRGSTTDKRPS